MKKSKGGKIIVMISFVFIMLGALLIGAGLVQGGSLRYLSVNSNTVSWWPFPFGSVGIGGYYKEWDDDIDNANYQNIELTQKQLDNIIAIDISADAADIEIYRGSTNRISYKVKNSDTLHINENQGYVSMDINHKGFVNNGGAKIRIQLTDRVYEQVKIDCALGDITIENIKAKMFDIDAKLGDIEMNEIYSENMRVSEKCGEIDIEGKLLGKSDISNKLGSTDVEINGLEQEYRYHVKNDLGDTRIQGNKHEIRTDFTGGNSSAVNEIIIDNSVGDVELEFK